MTFFYDLNKKLDSIREKPELTHGQLNERDMSRAAKGYEKYGKEGMEALAQAGREGKALDPIRDKYNKYDETMGQADEGNAFSKAVVAAKKDGIQPGEKIRVGGKEMPLKEKMSPAKQQSFAALAPPKDKITFADKIAGAKQEVDEMLGDVAAEAMKGAIGKMGANSHQARATMKHVNASNASPKVKAAIGKASADIEPGAQGYRSRAAALKAAGIKGAPGEVDEDEDNNPFTSWKKPRADRPKVGSIERGALHDIEHTATGRKVTRRVDPNTGNSVGADDDAPASGEKRGRGRPSGKGAGKSIGAKGPSGKSKLMTREGEVSTGNLQQMHQLVTGLKTYIQDPDGQAMLKELIGMVKHYMNQGGNQELDEKAVSKQQQKFMGMVHAAQKGEKPASKEVGKVAKSMGKKDAEDFASTKHKGLPNKVKEESTDKEDQKAERAGKKVAKDIEHDEGHKGQDDNRAEKAGKQVTKDIEYDDKKDRKEKKKDEVEENTVAGSIAPAMGGKAPKGPGGMQFGKGVYESALKQNFDKKLSTVLNETMSINASTDTEGHQSLTINASDEDATNLAQVLKLAGLGQSNGYGEVCPSCGSEECGCNQVDEDLANSPAPEYSDTDTMVNTLSGGLNGRKSTGQTTIPVVNLDPARGAIGPVAESTEARLWEIYNRYQSK
jgi:hypothetical protein